MAQANSGTPERVRRGSGDTAVAALLAAGALIERARAPRSGWSAAVPVIGVNTVAFLGQLKFWGAYLADPFQQVLVAAVLESLAIFWAWQAHRARMANDSAFRPQLAAYLFAAGVGVLNYSHYMKPGWQPTVAAVTFGGMSVISPWLWASYSRRENRDELKARGDIEDHAVRLGATRWLWHAYRCLVVMWKATWPGVTKPAEAIALYVPRRERKQETSGGPVHARNDGHSSDGRPAGNSVNLKSPAGNSPAGKAPSPPGPPSRKGAAPGGTPRREARKSHPAVTDSLSDLQRAVLAELLAHPDRELPGYRELSREKFGQERSRRAARVLELAKAARNGGSHDDS